MTDNARLTAALEGRYTIDRPLGEGGMATVYLADDVKHGRKVALKVLKPELAAVIGGERFLTEIKTTANLQHPHILPLFDSGEADGFLYYVMPYIEGETLRAKINRERQLGIDEALHIAKAVASALQYAHDRDVIHRDIKPENILLHAGEPVVADFGIALALSAAGGGRMTETGLSLGTPHYMSPEQATADRDLTNRSDVYALGCVLYEMLAGDPPQTGPTAQSVLMRILTETPRPVTDVRASVPPHVSAALAKALEKLPADRFESADAFSGALDDKAFQYTAAQRAPTVSVAAPAAPAKRRPATRLVPALVGALTLSLAVAAWGWLKPPPVQPVMRTVVDLGDIQVNAAERVVISPDGSRFAVAGTLNGQRGLFVRNADEEGFRLLTVEGDPRWPAFSPDGNWIAYQDNSDKSLMRTALSGGAPRPVVVPSPALNPTMPHWGDDGTIVFMGQDGVYRVPNTGGEPTRIGPFHLNPRLLPGERGVLLTAIGGGSTLYLDLAADTVRELVPGGIDAHYVETGHLLYSDLAGGLWAVAFDLGAGEIRGEATPVLEGVTVAFNRFARFFVSRNGTLVYGLGGGAAGAGPPPEELLVVSLAGDETVLPLSPRPFNTLRWSPDGEWVTYSGSEPGGDPAPMIYVYNVELGTTPRRMTFSGVNFNPVWSPDGTQIAFASGRDGTAEWDLFVKTVNDDAPPVGIFPGEPGRQLPAHWFDADGLVFSSGTSGSQNDLWTIHVPDSSTAVAYLTTESSLLRPEVSPPGDLAAYESNESGTYEIYVRSFPEPRQQTIVSQGGGRYVRWSPDGRTLYYWKVYPAGRADSLFAASVQREPTFAVLSTEFVLSGDYGVDAWDLHPDGDRFIIARRAGSGPPEQEGGAPEANPERYLVVVNWFEELKAAMGVGR